MTIQRTIIIGKQIVAALGLALNKLTAQDETALADLRTFIYFLI